MNHPQEVTCQAYLELFENLTPERVGEFDQWVSPDVHFRDPFNDVYDLESMKAILGDMFERAEQPRFSVLEHQLDGTAGFLRWNFTAKLPVIGRLNIEGVSRLQFDSQGRVSEHLDYWDSAPIYLRLPFIGRLLNKIKEKMALPEDHHRA